MLATVDPYGLKSLLGEIVDVPHGFGLCFLRALSKVAATRTGRHLNALGNRGVRSERGLTCTDVAFQRHSEQCQQFVTPKTTAVRPARSRARHTWRMRLHIPPSVLDLACIRRLIQLQTFGGTCAVEMSGYGRIALYQASTFLRQFCHKGHHAVGGLVRVRQHTIEQHQV